MGAAKAPTEPAKPRAVGAGAPGAVRQRLNRALAEAREAQRMSAEHEVRGVLAQRMAGAVDDAARRGDEVAMLRAADKLLELLDTLPLRSVSGGGADERGRDDGPGARLRAVMDSPPTVGDAAHA